MMNRKFGKKFPWWINFTYIQKHLAGLIDPIKSQHYLKLSLIEFFISICTNLHVKIEISDEWKIWRDIPVVNQLYSYKKNF